MICSEPFIDPEVFEAKLLEFNQKMMSCAESRYFNDNLLAYEQKFKEMDTTNNQLYPSLIQFKEWLLDLYREAHHLISDKELFLACFWASYKDQSLDAKNISALLIEIKYQ